MNRSSESLSRQPGRWSQWGRRLQSWVPGFPWSLAVVAFLSVLTYGVVTLAQSQPTTVTFLVRAAEAQQLQLLADQFEAEHPDINIDMVEGPNAADNVENLYTTSFLLGDSPYDLVYSDVVWIPKFAAAGWLMDLSDRISESELNQFSEADVRSGRYQGGLYRIPFRSDVGMLYYRTDVLDELGAEPPETFEELISLSKQAQEQAEMDWGYVWQGLQYEGLVTNFVEIVQGYGGFWIDADTLEVGLDQPEAIEAVKFMRSVIQEDVSPEGVTNYLEEDSLRVFENGNAVFLRNWPYAWAQLNQDDSEVVGDVALKSMVHAPNEASAATLGGWGFGIAKSTEHPDAAWKVVDFFTSAASQKQFVLEYAYLPSRSNLFEDPDILDKFPHYSRLQEVADVAVPRPPVGQYAQLSDILQRYLSSAITGQMSPEAAMAAAAGESRRVIGRGEASS